MIGVPKCGTSSTAPTQTSTSSAMMADSRVNSDPLPERARVVAVRPRGVVAWCRGRTSPGSRGLGAHTLLSSVTARRFAWRSARMRSSTIALRMSTPTTARCQKSWMPSTGSARLIVISSAAAEGRAPHRAASAEDRDAADDGRSHGGQLEPGAGLRGDGAVARRVHDSREAGQRARHGERDEHPAGDAQAVEVGRIRIRADRVELAAAADVAQVPAPRPPARSPRRS